MRGGQQSILVTLCLRTYIPSPSELTEDELAEQTGWTKVWGERTAIAAKLKRGKAKPLMLWEGADGLRLASRAPVPWKSNTVALTRIARDGTVTFTNTFAGKRAMLADPGMLILASWPGQYSQDIFVVDNPKAALEELKPAKRR
jgi:hypothetical protein